MPAASRFWRTLGLPEGAYSTLCTSPAVTSSQLAASILRQYHYLLYHIFVQRHKWKAHPAHGRPGSCPVKKNVIKYGELFLGFPPALRRERDELMTYYDAGQYDIAVIGAGHAGIEAALAAARMGLRTLCFTINLDAVGNMPCNPAIGGTGKGHLVRELDALGGEMGRAADRACIQYRILNRGKGPAVWSLRAQADRREYQKVMKHTLELQENLWVKQAEVVEVLTENGPFPPWSPTPGSVRREGGHYCYRHLPGGPHHCGRGGRGLRPDGLAAALPPDPVPGRSGAVHPPFQDGDAPRVNARSVDFSKMEVQPGDETPSPSPSPPRSSPQPGGMLPHSHHRRRPTPSSGPIWTAPPVLRGH